ncbi:MAG TPA: DUF4445 domain-containing protein, partial [Firmicutes bacterium]|nr:DUF4445 domain-containing protein [Bacillota bacterium]
MRLRFLDHAGRMAAEGDFPAGEGLSLWEAARRLRVALSIPCGGHGLCGKCAVQVDPAPEPTAGERRLLSAAELNGGIRLSCLCRPERDTTIRPAAGFPGEKAPGRESPPPAPAYPDRVPVDPGQAGVGAAVDLGTTTVAAGCVDLATGRVLGVAETPNPQARYGADVLVRLGYALQHPAAAAELRQAAGDGIRGAIAAAAEKAGVAPARLKRAVAVGNPAMHHLLLGLDVESLAKVPHEPAVNAPREEPAEALGLALAEEARVYLPPLIGGFVGSDALAVGLAEGLLAPGKPRLALDLGTNGEVLLASPGGVYACSTAAGPAFEGAGLRCGMRAEPGAIIGAEPGEPLRLTTVAGEPPRGLAGSGALATVATLVALEALSPDGRVRSPGELPGPAWPGLPERLVELPGGHRAVVLVPAAASATGEDIVLTQQDVRQLQLAKGAVRAALTVLLGRAGLDASDLEEVLLAGAFGQGLAPESALAAGLLPPIPASRLRPVGNAA